MEESRRYVRLGLFVVVGLSVLALGLFLLGGRNWFGPTFTFETYFNQSIAGLELGAPVRFRGVPLGRVSEILTSAATYERAVPLDQRREYIVVRVEVNLSRREAARMRQDAVTLAKKGLRAQTQLAGITGQQYLALDFLDPRKYPPLEFQWSPDYPYLPSAPSSSGEIIAKAQRFLASLNEADIGTLGQNLNALVSDLDTKVGELQVADLSAKARGMLGKLDSASDRLDVLLGNPALKQTAENLAVITARLRKVADDGNLDRMLKGIDDATEHLDVLLGDNQYDIRSIVRDLQVTAANLRVLSEAIKRYPAGALLGGPPDKVRLPGGSQ
jgi:phospholipid/cholesterol/gamma-HCH transport system substrate-binding protein/paraquat-inducible protein B